MIRTYSEMIKYHTIEDRFNYLRLRGNVGRETFGYDRYLNQGFYTSREWKSARVEVIARDEGCDLGVLGYEIYDKVLIHHMNPIKPEDIIHGNEDIFNPEYLITVSMKTHNGIHYGTNSNLHSLPPERRPGDTKLW